MYFIYRNFRIATCFFILLTWAVTKVESAPSSVTLSIGLELAQKDGHPVLRVRDKNSESSEAPTDDEKKGGRDGSSDEKNDSKALVEDNDNDNGSVDKSNNNVSEEKKNDSKSGLGSRDYDSNNGDSGQVRSTKALDARAFEPGNNKSKSAAFSEKDIASG